MQKRSTILTIIMSIMLAVTGLVSCSAPESKSAGASSSNAKSESADAKSIYLISVRVGGAAWSRAQRGFEEACAKLGWNGTYVAPTTANDTSQMANLFETALTHKADAVMGVFYDENVFGDIIKKAKSENTPVATVNVSMGEDFENFWIGTDQTGLGIAQADALAKISEGKEVKVVYLVQDVSSVMLTKSYSAFVEQCKKYPNITIHGMEQDNNNPIVAADLINNLKKADPSINAVICTNSTGATLGVANYVDENKLQNEFYTVGIDASADILNYVKSGALDCTLDQDFYRMGYEGVMMMKDFLEGKKVEYNNDSGTIYIDKSNVDQYAKDNNLTLDTP